MIFLSSKRVFLNKICPKTDKRVLLNANYYIADCPSPDRPGDHVSDFDIDEDGNYIERPKQPSGIKSASQFNVIYGNGCLNPGPYITTFLSENGDIREIQEKLYKSLMQYSTMSDVHDQVFTPARRGNGILFIIYYRDENIINFGGMIARYLADNFGEKITFVDPQFRDEVKGQFQYEPDIENARRVFRCINESKMLIGFLTAARQSVGIDEGIANMTVYLQAFNIQDLIMLYNLLWPNEPLPQNVYLPEQIKEIIIGKMISSGQINVNQSRLNVIEYYNPDGYY